MSWISITATDVGRRLTAAELTALKTAAKAGDQDGDTILAEAIADSVKQVRGYVAACARNILGEGDTLPDELRGAVLALVRDYLFTRLPGMKALNDDLRQRELERAVALLRDVAACKFLVVAPETAAPEQPGGPGFEVAESRTRIASPDKTSGLL